MAKAKFLVKSGQVCLGYYKLIIICATASIVNENIAVVAMVGWRWLPDDDDGSESLKKQMWNLGSSSSSHRDNIQLELQDVIFS